MDVCVGAQRRGSRSETAKFGVVSVQVVFYIHDSCQKEERGEGPRLNPKEPQCLENLVKE